MGDHELTKMVRDFYNKLNKDTAIKSELNDGDLLQSQIDIFEELSEEVKKRYYGSGITVPEDLAGKRILDIGCGSGSFVFILSKLVGPTGSVEGFDITDGLVETAKSQVDYHCKLWGYDQPNINFQVCNAEQMDKLGFQPDSFDIIVSNGVFCLVPDKDKPFQSAFKLLKPGGLFLLNDVYAEKDPPEEHKNNQTLWSMGTTGSMRWDTLATMAGAAGFTTPYLTCASPMTVVKEEYRQMLENGRFSCAGWRLFKPVPGKSLGSSRVTYNGTIPGYPEEFRWDVDLTFKKGQGVKVDSQLATTLATCYLKGGFTVEPVSSSVVTSRNQNPFAYMDKLTAQGKTLKSIYKIE